MKISIGSDHGGFLLKTAIYEAMLAFGWEVIDCGTHDQTSVDYPLFAKKVCRNIQNHISDFGVLICTTGIGMSIAANKCKHIRAALVHCMDCALLSRQHNDSNIICLGAKYTNIEDGIAMVKAFVETPFSGERHLRRVKQIEEDDTC